MQFITLCASRWKRSTKNRSFVLYGTRSPCCDSPRVCMYIRAFVHINIFICTSTNILEYSLTFFFYSFLLVLFSFRFSLCYCAPTFIHIRSFLSFRQTYKSVLRFFSLLSTMFCLLRIDPALFVRLRV